MNDQPSRKVRRAAKQGMPVMAGRTIRQWAGDLWLILTGKHENTHTIEIEAWKLQVGDLVMPFGGDRVTEVNTIAGTTHVRLTGVDHELPWSCDLESDRLLEVRHVQRGRSPY